MFNDRNNKKIAWMNFYPEGNGSAKPGYVLHHKDPSWKTEDPERYAEWRIEDLVMMRRSEHSRLHNKGKNVSPETREKISARKIGDVPWNRGKNYSCPKISKQRIGKHYWNNGIEEKCTYECPGEGWMKGRLFNPNFSHPCTMKGKILPEETKAKLSTTFKGLVFWNDGQINKRSKECPGEGWMKGRLKSSER